MENLKPQRLSWLIGGISVLLIAIVAYALISRERVHPLTPKDIKATVPLSTFTGGPGSSAASSSATASEGP